MLPGHTCWGRQKDGIAGRKQLKGFSMSRDQTYILVAEYPLPTQVFFKIFFNPN